MKTGSKEKDLFLKLCRYCAYRERCESELRDKMQKLEVSEEWQNKFLLKLKAENFLNERRFAASYARGKFRNNAWGILKITRALRVKGIRQDDIVNGLKEIDKEEYIQLLIKLMHKQMRKIKLKNILARRKKVADYLQRKGFEMSLVWSLLKQEFPD